MLSTASSADSIVHSFPQPPGKVVLLHGDRDIFPFALTMAAQAMRKGMPIAVVDGANRFDVHLLARFARERRMNPDAFLQQIYISRGFTCYQMEQAIVGRLPAFLKRIGSTVGMVFGLLDTFYDEQAPLREVQQILARVRMALTGMKNDGMSILVVCREQRVAPEERNRLFTTLQRSVDVSYQLTGGKEVSRRGAETAKVTERMIKLQAIDNAHKPVPDQRNIKIDQNAQMEARKTEVGQQLFLVNRKQRLDRFEFEDDSVLNHDIGAKGRLKAQ
jgi:hypothetical protein